MKSLLNFFIVPVFLFCSFQKENGLTPSRNMETEKKDLAYDKIIYLFFKPEQDRFGNDKIVLQESKIAPGRLKEAPVFDKREAQNGDFIITISAGDGKEVGQQLVKNPLKPELEVYEKEGITRHKASLQNAEFSVRFSYSESIEDVKIEKVTEKGNQLIFTQKLSS
ncbi:hypothetical protein [Chryseobacterium sp.]|uniref:hypothetical protein n=1 Tax=Chryseobacterium sp. TaxID=1871047 RepID=UPI003341E73A